MDYEALLEMLTNGPSGKGSFSAYPLVPKDAAELIVTVLLSDLPDDRKRLVREAISEWGSERESAVSATTYESSFP